MRSIARAAIERGGKGAKMTLSPVAFTDPIDGLRAASSIPEAVAEALAVEQYGLAAVARRLDSERDQNFRLDMADGASYVLKIANPGEDRSVTNLQTEALRHLASVDPLLPVPVIFPALNGATECTHTFDDGTTRVVRLLSFLVGTPSHQATPSQTLRRDIGRCAARLALGLSGFSHSGSRHKLLWDIRHAAELRPLIDLLPPDQRDLIGHILDRFVRHVRPALPSLPTQVVHNDLNPHNIIVDPEYPERVCGIIDFGDLTATARVNDLAIAAAYQVADHDDPLAPACDLISAYHDLTPLELRERALIFDLIATRMVMTILISNARAARYPENRDYILRNTDKAAARLRRMAMLPREQALRQIEQTCGRE